MTDTPRSYPRRIACGDAQIDITPMTTDDRDALAAFIASLPEHDLVFVPRDLRHPKVLEAWMHALERGDMPSLIAREDGKMVGCTAIVTDPLGWSRHVGELRVLVSPAGRGKGLGRALIQECFAQAIERGLKKLVAQMTTHQPAAIAVFEELSFRAEALLHNHVIDRDGGTYDLVVLSHDVDEVAARQEMYGLGDVDG
jgi:L-amino acid N-acyltransferase YncA